VDPPLERIASVLEEAQTVQYAATYNIIGWPRGSVARAEGVIDFGKRMSQSTIQNRDTTTELFAVGAEVFRRMTLEEQQQSGKTWVRVPDSDDDCPYESTGFAEEAASLRLLATPIGYAAEEHNGETLQHHVLLVKPRKDERRPGLETLWEHLRWLGTDRMTYEVWLSEDGQIRLMQQSYKVLRMEREVKGVSSVSRDFWRFGLDLDLQPPSPDEILDEPLPE
jgi:hypothetical protein